MPSSPLYLRYVQISGSSEVEVWAVAGSQLTNADFTAGYNPASATYVSFSQPSGWTAFANANAATGTVVVSEADFSLSSPVGTAADGELGVFTFTQAAGAPPFTLNLSQILLSDINGSTPIQSDLTITGTVNPPGFSWLTDAPGNFSDPTRWAGNIVPGSTADASINFADLPQVLHSAGADAVQSLTNTAGSFVMAGGTLTATLLENGSTMRWSGGSLVLNGTAATASLSNTGTFTIAPNGQRLSATGTADFANSGTVIVDTAGGLANIDVPLTNTGNVIVNHGTLSLNGGGTANAYNLEAGHAGTLQFGLPDTGPASTFTVTGGFYAADNTVLNGGTLDLSAASPIVFVDSLSLAAGRLSLGAQNAAVQGRFTQGSTSTPVLSGTGALTVYGGASLSGGIETGAGTTRLLGTSVLASASSVQFDGGRTLENDGWLNWSAGNIDLGAGGVGTSASISNVSGAVVYATADGRLTNQGARTGTLNNAGLIVAASAGGEIDIDAALSNPGVIQVLGSTLGLNGGGSSAGDHMFVAPGAVVQFGTTAGAASGGSFAITSGVYAIGNTAITGGTLDVSAAAGAVFPNILNVSAGRLALGAVSATDQNQLVQTGGTIAGGGTLTVYGNGRLTGGVQTGAGTTKLLAINAIGGGFQVDGGRTIENDSWLNWSSGNIVLGAGDTSLATHAGTLTNASGAVLYVTAAGARITAPGTGTVNNAGVMAVYGGLGEVDIDAALSNPGVIQLISGTLSLNGGGGSAGNHIFAAAGATLQFGTGAGVFSITGGGYLVGNTVVNGGTLDLSASGGATFSTALSVSGAGALRFGGATGNAVSLAQSGGTVSGTGTLTVSGGAQLGGGLQTGAGRTVLQGASWLNGGAAFDGDRTLENDGTLVWNGGTVSLGSGDAGAVTHAGTIVNAAGAVIDIQGDGSVNGAGFSGSAAINNAGTIMKSGGLGSTTVYAAVSNSGTVDVTAGTLVFEQAVSGAGTFLVDGSATLDFASTVGSGGTMQFLHPGGTLEVETTGMFGANISGFATGDLIDAAGVGFSASDTIGFASGTLTVSDGTHSAGFGLSGTYAAASFHIATDGHGGTGISYG